MGIDSYSIRGDNYIIYYVFINMCTNKITGRFHCIADFLTSYSVTYFMTSANTPYNFHKSEMTNVMPPTKNAYNK